MEELQEQLSRIERLTLLGTKQALTINDVALLSGLSKSHIYKLTCNKEIPHYKPFGKLVYFDKDEVNEWLLQNRVIPIAEAEQMAIAHTLQKGGKV